MSFILIPRFCLNSIGSGELEFEEFCQLAAKFLIEEDEESLKEELREAFRIYDKEGKKCIVIRDMEASEEEWVIYETHRDNCMIA